MTDANARIRLTTVRCIDEGDGPGSAEPYLWTVFFKIDGTTASVTSELRLTGRSTVIATVGNQGDLPNHDVDDGEIVLVPLALGQFRTRLRPIPLQAPIGGVSEVGGVLGMVAVLMEEDNTPASAIAAGHRALNRAVRRALDELIPTLGFLRQEPTPDDIEKITQQVGNSVLAAVSNDVSAWEWLTGLGNMDEKIGSMVEQYSQDALLNAGTAGITFAQRFRSEGEWELTGRASARRIP
ncbi:hypothetical protein AB0H92_01505 [Streptomyces phaeochromogenes]|uniref:hypothetical protein n=1 Tax=Streptomyces phaeochromogenes TaxID=1923 RepID=UPI003400DD52